MDHYLRSIEAEAIAHLRRLVEVNSYTHNREGVNGVADIVAELFEPLGFKSRRVPSVTPDCGDHLFLENDVDGPGVLMVSHNDTVYPAEQERRNDFAWREEGERIYGPGVADIKGGTVVIWMVLKALREKAPELLDRLRFSVLINATEEGGCAEFYQLAQPYVRTGDLACLVFEAGTVAPEGGSTIVVSRKGAARFLFEAFGKEAHSGNHHDKGASAVVELADKIQRLHALTDYERGVTFNVGLIEGGSAVNAVAGYACARVDMRAGRDEDFAWGRARVRELEGDGVVVSADGKHRCRVEISERPGFPPWEPNEASELLGDLVVKLGAELGQTIVPTRRKGASDAAHMYKFLPTIDGMGPIGRNTHCSVHDPERGLEQESVDRDSFVPRARLSLALIERLARE